MSKATDKVIIGRFGRPHGIKGLISVYSFTEPRENILQYRQWLAYINKEWQLLRVLGIEINEKLLVAQIEGYENREQVMALTNVEIAVTQSQLPILKEGEFYWFELIGMQVINQQGILLGKVVDLISTGANDVLIIEGKKRHLVPYLPGQFIFDINPSENTMIVDWDVDF